MNTTRNATLFFKKQYELIDNLFETPKDGQEGLKQAAETVKNAAMAALHSTDAMCVSESHLPR